MYVTARSRERESTESESSSVSEVTVESTLITSMKIHPRTNRVQIAKSRSAVNKLDSARGCESTETRANLSSEMKR